MEAKQVQKPLPAFSMKDKIGYMFGDVGNCFLLGLMNAFLMIYYTNILGLPAGLVGTLFFASTMIDAFADVIVGRVADVAKVGHEGRFRPWIRRMKWPTCLTFLLMFLPFVKHFSEPGKIAYVVFTYILFGLVFACINIPYGSLSSTMSANADDKASLSVFRSVGSAVGAGGTGFALSLIIYTENAAGHKILSEQRLFWSAIGCAVLAFISYSILYHYTHERIASNPKQKVRLHSSIKAMLHDRGLVSLIMADIVVTTCTSLSGITTTYLFNDYFNNNHALSVALLFTYGTTIALAPFAKWITVKFGKKEMCATSLTVTAMLYAILYFLHIQNPWLYLVILFVATLGTSTFSLMIWAFINDVNDNHQVITGMREDGTIYGINFFGRKIAQALANGVGGVLLSIIGYQSSTSGGRVQTQAVLDHIYMLANLVPALLMITAAAILAFWYPLTRQRVREVTAKLEAAVGKGETNE
ncbi:MFS transporter [Lactiplantibacillus plajomi]|uniref:MFS transporter n=2 Tax=Lactiplantibacillus plajomi TaxID=1457217 RepID=A0ABV6K5Y1_9LACO|nr:glycoside-pentoside-hexuronide (GPH):cation symporter [Lactiplantibacillus plajomi]